MVEKFNEIKATLEEVVDYMRINNRFAPELRQVVKRKVAVKEARKMGIKISTEELQKAADTFRHLNDLSSASDTETWLKSNGISLESLEKYLETNLMIYKLKNKLENDTDKSEYLSTQKIKDVVGDMIYEEFLKSKMK